jgi:hypothetical protein
LFFNELGQCHLAFVKQPLGAYFSHSKERVIAVFDEKMAVFYTTILAVIGMSLMPVA